MTVLIIGAGKVGTALAGALNTTEEFRAELYDAAAEINDLPAAFPAIRTGRLEAPQIKRAQLIVISVPDDVIPQVVEVLQNFDLRDKHVLHTSGFRTSADLGKLQAKGAYTASWHPLQTFHKRFLAADIWHNIVCTFEGALETRKLTERICRQLGCRQTGVSAVQKQALHLAAAISANHSVALLAMAEQLLQQTGLQHEQISALLLPLMQRMMENFRSTPAQDILSGPARRGDVQTLQGHLNLLHELAGKAEQQLYVSFVRWIADNLNCDNPQQLKQWLDEAQGDKSPVKEPSVNDD